MTCVSASLTVHGQAGRRAIQSTRRIAGPIAIVALAALCQFCPGSARADVITTYTLSNTVTDNNASVTGSFEIDQTIYNYHDNSGFVESTIQITGDSDPTFNGAYDTLFFYNGDHILLENAHGAVLSLLILSPPIQNGQENQTLESLNYVSVSTTEIVADNIFQGTLTAVTPVPAPAPEPASIAVLGVGLAGVMFIRRRSAPAA